MNDDTEPIGASGLGKKAFFASLDGSRVLHIHGELDVASAPALRAALDQVARLDAFVTLDFAEVTFMDSSAVQVLVEAARAVGEQGRIVLVRLSPVVQTDP